MPSSVRLLHLTFRVDFPRTPARRLRETGGGGQRRGGMMRRGFGVFLLAFMGVVGCGGQVSIARHAETQPKLVVKPDAPSESAGAGESSGLVELPPVEKRLKV